MTSRQGFTLLLVTVVGIFSIIFLGIIYGFTHPSEPLTSEQEYTRACTTASGVPDTHTDNWTCQK